MEIDQLWQSRIEIEQLLHHDCILTALSQLKHRIAEHTVHRVELIL